MTTAEPTSVTEAELRGWPLPAPGDDKQSRGTVLVVGGSVRTPGAVLLAGESALRAGAGRLQIATERSVAPGVAVSVPECLVVPLPGEPDGSLGAAAADAVLAEAESVEVVLIGPGLMQVDGACALMEAVVPQLHGIVVVDALGTVFATRHPDGLQHVAAAVLTVNPGELARILDRDEGEVGADPVAAATDAARRTGAVVVCGGSGKTVAAPDGRCWTSDVGNPGLGVSGSGDTQAGIVAGLLALGADPARAAVWGSYVHGAVGDLLALEVGGVGFLARDVPERVPSLLAALSS